MPALCLPTAPFSPWRQVDVLDARLREEQEQATRALDVIMSGSQVRVTKGTGGLDASCYVVRSYRMRGGLRDRMLGVSFIICV